jgi:hypothetical protein
MKEKICYLLWDVAIIVKPTIGITEHKLHRYYYEIKCAVYEVSSNVNFSTSVSSSTFRN